MFIMKFKIFLSFLILFQVAAAVFARTPVSVLRKQAEIKRRNSLTSRDVDPSTLYPAYNISVPVDHFQNESKYAPHSSDNFNLRYWFDASYYKEGGPVIVLESGETDASERLPFLQKGIVSQLMQATGGVGVILEHRYYGTSFPTADLSTENLRFLTTEQAMADVAYFAQNVKFAGVNKTLTAPGTPYIVYGGSYAGAFVAFLRTQYPHLFWGAISSSGVTKAIYDYWQYFEPIRQLAPPDCVRATQQLTNVVDNILMKPNNSAKIAELKGVFGLGNLTDNRDFANSLTGGIYGWQSRSWDPAINSPGFFYYCQNVTATTRLYPDTASLGSTVNDLLAAGGYGNNEALQIEMLNYIGYINLTVVSGCEGETLDQCLSTLNTAFYQQDDYSQQGWRSWDYQVCTQWGYIQTGSGVPKGELPLISRTLDLEYLTVFCRDAFNITSPPDVQAINKYGGFDIHYSRLAIIGGQADPWRPATPLADEARPRKSTTSEPVLEIPDAVHHWDENGLFPNETTATLPPNSIVYAQQFEKDFVLEWMNEWQNHYKR
ncbi:extracelular serine carboxypeptidase [Lepidopterella palustris CBS 459.81]|uniref:Extracelular serine carboxypeptidase n=1 Tax=Lepidopterella palustris CBS 459.81 TaxID=1314670 RepID=A0A8E2E5Q5_9PEZI|nr:extracelular serine carboxypeptidase [Lepidopterella palustris CBS 459.81]